MNETVGIAHYWSQSDAITHGVAYLLLLMSVVSWYYIISKAWSSLRIRQSTGALEAFWKAPSLADAIALLKNVDREDVYSPLAVQSAEAANVSAESGSLNASSDPGELITRTLRREINRVSSRLEAGWRNRSFCRAARHGLGNLSRTGSGVAGRNRANRQGGRACRGSLDHDGAGSHRSDSCSTGIQRLHPRQPRDAGGTGCVCPRPACASDHRRPRRQVISSIGRG